MSARRAEQGSIMIIVVTMIAALLAGAGIAVYLQISDTKSTGLIRAARSSLYCAEAGLVRARPYLGTNWSDWSLWLDQDPSNDPQPYPYTGDIDGDGTDDFEVTIRDNDDEPAAVANDPTRDNDLKVFIISRCTKYPNSPREVLELVQYKGQGNLYRNQSGQGSGNTGNTN